MTDDTDTWQTDAETRLEVLASNIETLAAIAGSLADEYDGARRREYEDLADALREEALAAQDVLATGASEEFEETFEMVLHNLIQLKASTSRPVVEELDSRAAGRLGTFE